VRIAAAPAVLLFGTGGTTDDGAGAVVVGTGGKVMVVGGAGAARVAGLDGGGGEGRGMGQGAAAEACNAADATRSMPVRQSAFDDDEVYEDRDPDDEP